MGNCQEGLIWVPTAVSLGRQTGGWLRGLLRGVPAQAQPGADRQISAHARPALGLTTRGQRRRSRKSRRVVKWRCLTALLDGPGSAESLPREAGGTDAWGGDAAVGDRTRLLGPRP